VKSLLWWYSGIINCSTLLLVVNLLLHLICKLNFTSVCIYRKKYTAYRVWYYLWFQTFWDLLTFSCTLGWLSIKGTLLFGLLQRSRPGGMDLDERKTFHVSCSAFKLFAVIPSWNLTVFLRNFLLHCHKCKRRTQGIFSIVPSILHSSTFQFLNLCTHISKET
jgi:hypothetical protein